MPAGELESRCLKLMDEVSKRRTSVVITRRGKPVAKLVPIGQPGTDLFGCMKGTRGILAYGRSGRLKTIAA